MERLESQIIYKCLGTFYNHSSLFSEQSETTKEAVRSCKLKDKGKKKEIQLSKESLNNDGQQ